MASVKASPQRLTPKTMQAAIIDHYRGRRVTFSCVSTKQRISASVDADLAATGHAAVVAGRAESLSAWVNEALRAQAERDRRLEALGVFLASFEEDHGTITDSEIAAATRSVQGRAVVVRGV